MDYSKENKRAYDSISKTWDTKRSFYWKPVIEFLDKVKDKSSKKLLDLGCGTGRHLELAKEKGFKIENLLGSDISKGQLEITKEKGFNTLESDMLKLEIKNEEFDIVTCIAAHHHFLEKDKQLQSLKEMNRILKENGKILLCNWFPTKEYVEKEIKRGKFEFFDKQRVKVKFTDNGVEHTRYYYMFEEEELKKLCEIANFKIKDSYHNQNNLYLELSKN